MKPLTRHTALVGNRVRTRVEFSNVPEGTEGVIDEDYTSGGMVAWDLPARPLPRDYFAYDGVPAVTSGILRDGFDKATELHYLELVEETEQNIADKPRQHEDIRVTPEQQQRRYRLGIDTPYSKDQLK